MVGPYPIKISFSNEHLSLSLFGARLELITRGLLVEWKKIQSTRLVFAANLLPWIIRLQY